MREIRTSGLMSGEGKRSVAAWPKPPRPSSTLLKAQKNDDLDAEAIAEAASRPTMRFVEVKSQVQSDIQALHRARERLVSLAGLSLHARPAKDFGGLSDRAECWVVAPVCRG
jgi:Transposase